MLNDHGYGIFYGWKIVFVSLAVTTTAFGVLYSFGVFFKLWLNEWGCSRAYLSGVFSLAFFVYGISSFFMGNLTDRYGPRKTIAVGGIIMGAGAVLTSMVYSASYLYITFGMMIGIGVGTSYSPTASTVSRWFKVKKGMAIGIVVAGLGLGTFVYSPLARVLIAWSNWRIAFLCFGVMIWTVYLTAAWIVRKEPLDLGLKPYGEIGNNSRRKDEREVKDHLSPDDLLGVNTVSALKKPYFWILFFVHCLWVLGMAIPMVHLVPYATDMGIEPGKAAAMLAVLGGVSILGRLVLGGIGERIGTKNSLLLLLFLQSMTMIWLAGSKGPWMLWTFAFCFGFTYGGLASIFPLITVQYFGLFAMGSIFGLVLLGATLGGVTGPWLAGLIFDVTNKYFWGFLIGAGSMATGILLTLFLPSADLQ